MRALGCVEARSSTPVEPLRGGSASLAQDGPTARKWLVKHEEEFIIGNMYLQDDPNPVLRQDSGSELGPTERLALVSCLRREESCCRSAT